MKKILALALAAALALSLAACGGTPDGGASDGGAAHPSAGSTPDGSGADHSSADGSGETAPGGESSSAPEVEGETGAEALLAQAEAITFEDLAQATFDGVDGAQAQYCGKVLKVEGSWTYSYTGGLDLTMKLVEGNSSVWLVVTLSEDDAHALEEMSQDQPITVVGLLDEEAVNEGGGASEAGGATIFTMRTEAYLVH